MQTSPGAPMNADTVILDTDAASGLYRHRYLGRPLDARLAVLTVQHQLVISAITLGEASYGMNRAKWGPVRVQRLLSFYEHIFTLAPVDHATAHEYGRLRAATEAVGNPVADNDLWIAATATAVDLPLLTRNRRHFEPLALHGLRLL